MSDLPYFQLYVGDYDRKTAHLSAVEDGMYFRLLRLCWTSPGCKIPADEAWIMRKTRARTEDEQAAVRAVIEEFFRRGKGKIWNDRLFLEFAKANDVHAGRVKGGKRSAAAKALKRNNPDASSVDAEPVAQGQLEPGYNSEGQSSYIGGGGGGARAHAREAPPEPDPQPPPPDLPPPAPPPEPDPTVRERLLAAMGIGPDGVAGPSKFIGTRADMAEAARWLDLPGMSVEAVCEEIRRLTSTKADGPPSSFKYFTPAMRRLSAALSAPPLHPDEPAGSRRGKSDERQRFDQTINAIADGLSAGTIHLDTSGRDPFEV